MPIGSLNPLPFSVGGGPTPSQKAYNQLKRAVGEGGSAKSEDGLDALWRRSKAKGLAVATSAKRRALRQAWPFYATDLIPYYERLTGAAPAPDDSEAKRREEVTRLYVAKLRVDLPSLDAQLKEIDPRLAVNKPSYSQSTITQFGRAFAPLSSTLYGSPTYQVFQEPGFTIAPNYSTEFVVRVVFQVGYVGALTIGDQRLFERVKALLLDVLPSWVAFSITTGVGFILNESPLDLTGMNP